MPRVIRGSIITAGAVIAPGVVRYDAPGDSWFGPFEPRPAAMDEIERLARLLTDGGLPPTRSPTPAARSGRKSFSTPPPARYPR